MIGQKLMKKKKKKYESPSEYRILYKHKGEVKEQYHYYNCWSSQEAFDTFVKIAEKRGWDDLKIIHVEKFDRWHNTWEILDKLQTD